MFCWSGWVFDPRAKTTSQDIGLHVVQYVSLATAITRLCVYSLLRAIFSGLQYIASNEGVVSE
jgi:hypothetical protein